MVGLARWARFVLGPVIVRARGEFLTPLAKEAARQVLLTLPGRDRAKIAAHQVAIWAVRPSTADSGAASSVARPWRAAIQAAPW
jgi:hypothetical protein